MVRGAVVLPCLGENEEMGFIPPGEEKVWGGGGQVQT